MNGFLKEIDHGLFVNASLKHLFSGSIGAHTRHIIEFYRQFLISLSNCHIDYDSRERNLKIETDKEFAISCLENLITDFNRLELDESNVLVYSSDGKENKTSIGRELSYLSEHTIHHFALMRLIAESEGFNFNALCDFGIAQSTLSYRITQNN